MSLLSTFLDFAPYALLALSLTGAAVGLLAMLLWPDRSSRFPSRFASSFFVTEDSRLLHTVASESIWAAALDPANDSGDVVSAREAA